MTETIDYAVHEGVATLLLRRPEVRNALNAEMLYGLQEALQRARQDDDVRGLFISGAGSAFCAGQDLTTFEQAMRAGEVPDVQRLLEETYHPVIRAIYDMPKPVIAVVNGAAAGAGMSLALACDLRIMAEEAFFTAGFVRIGLVPDSGFTFFLSRLVGPARAFELAATGRRVGADEALRIGLANLVVPADELLRTTQEVARLFAVGPVQAIAWTKQLLQRAGSLDLEEALQAEAALQAKAIATDEHRAGVQAFLSGKLGGRG